jgi:hypothetical protein
MGKASRVGINRGLLHRVGAVCVNGMLAHKKPPVVLLISRV